METRLMDGRGAALMQDRHDETNSDSLLAGITPCGRSSYDAEKDGQAWGEGMMGAEEQCCKILLERSRPSDWLLRDGERDGRSPVLPSTKEEVEQELVSKEKEERQKKLEAFLAKVKEMKERDPGKYAKKKFGRSPPSGTAAKIALKCDFMKYPEGHREQKLQEFLADVKKPKQSEPAWVRDILLQRHLQQYHETMKVQPPRHTQHQREMAMIYERETQEQRNHDELMVLRAEKQMEFMIDMYGMEKNAHNSSMQGNSKEHAIDDLYPLHDPVGDLSLVSVGDDVETGDPFVVTSPVSTSLFAAVSSTLYSPAVGAAHQRLSLNAGKPFLDETHGVNACVNNNLVACEDLPPEESDSDLDYIGELDNHESEEENGNESDEGREKFGNGSPLSDTSSLTSTTKSLESKETPCVAIETIAADPEDADVADNGNDEVSCHVDPTADSSPPVCESSAGRCSTCHHCLELPLFSTMPNNLAWPLSYNSIMSGIRYPQIPSLPLWLLLNDQLLPSDCVQLKYTPTPLLFRDSSLPTDSAQRPDGRNPGPESQQAMRKVSGDEERGDNSGDTLLSNPSEKLHLSETDSFADLPPENHHVSGEWQETAGSLRTRTLHTLNSSERTSSQRWLDDVSHSATDNISNVHFFSGIKDSDKLKKWKDDNSSLQCHSESERKILLRSASLPKSVPLNPSSNPEPQIRRPKYGPQRRKRIVNCVSSDGMISVADAVQVEECDDTSSPMDVNVHDSPSYPTMPNTSDNYVPLRFTRSQSKPCPPNGALISGGDDWCETPLTTMASTQNQRGVPSKVSAMKPECKLPGFALKLPTRNPFPFPHKSQPWESQPDLGRPSREEASHSVRPLVEDCSWLLASGRWEEDRNDGSGLSAQTRDAASNSDPCADRLRNSQQLEQIHTSQGYRQPYHKKLVEFHAKDNSSDSRDELISRRSSMHLRLAAGRGKRLAAVSAVVPGDARPGRDIGHDRGENDNERKPSMSVLDRVLSKHHCYMDREEMWDKEETNTCAGNSNFSNSVHVQEETDLQENHQLCKDRYAPTQGSRRQYSMENNRNMKMILTDKFCKVPSSFRRDSRKPRVATLTGEHTSCNEYRRGGFKSATSDCHPSLHSPTASSMDNIFNVTFTFGNNNPQPQDSRSPLVSGEWESDKENNTSALCQNSDQLYDHHAIREPRKPRNNFSRDHPTKTFTAPRFERLWRQRAERTHQSHSEHVQSRMTTSEEYWN